ncbi:hypothetical protein [Actinomadura sp. 9N407]|uniref:hypothetical protein n=1 Tax=Actinomadura sp. 9N407 TaxID=3375154 RepID=UPI003795547F
MAPLGEDKDSATGWQVGDLHVSVLNCWAMVLAAAGAGVIYFLLMTSPGGIYLKSADASAEATCESVLRAGQSGEKVVGSIPTMESDWADVRCAQHRDGRIGSALLIALPSAAAIALAVPRSRPREEAETNADTRNS